MKRIAFVLLLLACAAFAATEFEQSFGTQTQKSGLPDVFRDWRVLSILSIITSVILIGIGYAVGIGLEMPEIKAWAGNELVQAFANVLIIITLMATIALLDVVAEEMVQYSGLAISCTGGQSCLGNVSVAYLDSYISTASEDARSVANNAIDAAGWANRRFGIYCLTILCAQVGTSFSVVGHYMLDQDRYTIVFEYYANLLASLEAQKFFVTHISFNVGPLLLAAGIVARTFFFTRKIGGLLIAVAAGIMFFFPAMYVFDWLTLNTALTGDKANEDTSGAICPDECKSPHAWAVIEDGTAEGKKLGSMKEVYDAFPNSQAADATAIAAGTVPQAVPSEGPYAGMTVISCMVLSEAACPLSCRELPYPTSLTQCVNLSANVPQNCATLPDKCWVRRLATQPAMAEDSEPVLSMCPRECKVIPPLAGDCNTGNCLLSRSDCRVYKRIGYSGNDAADFQWSPTPPEGVDSDQLYRCMLAKDCNVSNNAYNSCSYAIPETGSCAELCDGCPEVCRVTTTDINRLPASLCINSSSHQLTVPCQMCPIGCKVNATYIEELDTAECSGCPAEKRIVTYGETMPGDYINGSCDISTSCTTDDRVPIPRNSCEQCLFADETEMFEPPIQTACNDLCRASDDVPVKGASAYTGIGGEGLVGPTEVQNVSKLMLPAYVLPLLNIAATLIFIKGLSTILGGDIDIPGISKVF